MHRFVHLFVHEGALCDPDVPRHAVNFTNPPSSVLHTYVHMYQTLIHQCVCAHNSDFGNSLCSLICHIFHLCTLNILVSWLRVRLKEKLCVHKPCSTITITITYTYTYIDSLA